MKEVLTVGHETTQVIGTRSCREVDPLLRTIGGCCVTAPVSSGGFFVVVVVLEKVEERKKKKMKSNDVPVRKHPVLCGSRIFVPDPDPAKNERAET